MQSIKFNSSLEFVGSGVCRVFDLVYAGCTVLYVQVGKIAGD